MLTIADEGGEGGQAIADDCWRGGEGGSENPLKLADIICGQPLIVGQHHTCWLVGGTVTKLYEKKTIRLPWLTKPHFHNCTNRLAIVPGTLSNIAIFSVIIFSISILTITNPGCPEKHNHTFLQVSINVNLEGDDWHCLMSIHIMLKKKK